MTSWDPDEASDVLVSPPQDDKDSAFFAQTQTADGSYNDPANLGKYIYQVTRLANILRKAGGIAVQGLQPGQGGKAGGSVEITGKQKEYFGVSLQDASEVNSRQKVATSTNRKDGIGPRAGGRAPQHNGT